MIKIKRKPFQEIQRIIEPYARVLNVACGGCASVCLGGGQKEAKILNAELELASESVQQHKQLDVYTVERACNMQYLRELESREPSFDCIISMACSAGVQLLAEKFPHKPVFPVINTIAIGVDRDVGLYQEVCRACGDCVIGYTGGLCPITRCAKSLFNGPCGGTNQGMCEINPDIPCVWHQIYERLKQQNRLQDMLKIEPCMEWRNQTQRTVVQAGYEDRFAAEK